MSKKNLIILLITLLIAVPFISMASATYYHDEVGYKDVAKDVFNCKYFNGTIVDKYVDDAGYYRTYLVDVNGTTFYLNYNMYSCKKEFYIGDKVTIYGSAVNHEDNMHMMDSYEFNGKYKSDSYSSAKKFPRIYLCDYKIRLADGFDRSQSSSTTTTDRYNQAIRILKATIVSGEYQKDQTNCTVFVGKAYAGESVKISVLYSYNGKKLNQGNKVPKTVSDSGKIKVPTLNVLTDYPDKAIITIYDSNGNKLDTQTVTLEPNSEPQTFKFFDDPEYASNGAQFVGYAGDGTWANYYKDGHYYTVDGDLIG